MRKNELMEEKMETRKFPMNLQFFAESNEAEDDGADGSNEAGGDGDDQDDSEADEDGEEEAKFTQADMDKAIEKRIARERRKWERKQTSEKKDDKEDSKDDSDDDAVKQAEVRAQKAEMKILCYEHDISKDCVDDVIALAHSYLDDDTDMEDAIEKVVKKYPHFTKSSADEEDKEQKKAWGQRQTKKLKEKTSGVEAAFLKKNPGLKID